MWNIYLKVTIERFSKLPFFRFKTFVTRSVFGELQLTQITLNFKTSCSNLKIRGTKTVCGFSITLILKGIMTCELKLWWVGACERKKMTFFVPFFFPKRNVFYHLCFISMYCMLNTLSEYIYRYISKNFTSYTFVACF